MCDYLSSQVWSESSDGSGAVNFLTGMGGFLQAVLFGYTGFRWVIHPPVRHNKKHLNMYAARRQKTDELWVFFLEFRRKAWPFPHFFPMTFLSSAFVA